MTLEKFQTLADAYGATLDRWPIQHRPAALQFLASDPAAHAIITEARALDRLLDLQPPLRDGVTEALADRIVTAATSGSARQFGHQRDQSPNVVVALPRRQPQSGMNAGSNGNANGVLSADGGTPAQPVATGSRARGFSRVWPIAAALAASLAFGITIGVHDLTHAPVRGLVVMASASGDTEVDQFIAALHADGIASGTDEERK